MKRRMALKRTLKRKISKLEFAEYEVAYLCGGKRFVRFLKNGKVIEWWVPPKD